jgi:hypothetical protein
MHAAGDVLRAAFGRSSSLSGDALWTETAFVLASMWEENAFSVHWLCSSVASALRIRRSSLRALVVRWAEPFLLVPAHLCGGVAAVSIAIYSTDSSVVAS